MNVFPLKPLGFIKEGLEKIGQDVSYVYDDLVFPTHTAFLIQFGKENNELNIYFNKETDPDEIASLKEMVKDTLAADVGFLLEFKGTFQLEQMENEELNIRFYEKNDLRVNQ